jgi:5-methylcytosine-specific restriction enzyme A
MDYKTETAPTAFPPTKKRKGGKVFRLSCGHCTDCVFGPFRTQSVKYLDCLDEDKPKVYSCNFCKEDKEGYPSSYEVIEVPTLIQYECWNCGMWISDIEWNKQYPKIYGMTNALYCSNCGSYNQITPTTKRDPIESRLRHEVFKRDNYKCLECGKDKKETTLHVDHIIPVSKGGTDELSNLQTLCQACNLAKSDKNWCSL